MRIYVAMVSVLALIGCGNGGSMGGSGEMGQAGEMGQQGPIGPHVTVKDKNGLVLGIALREEIGEITVMTYKSTVPGLQDGWVMNNFSNDDPVYYLSTPLAINWQVHASQNVLIWNPQLPKGNLYRIGDKTTVSDRNCCASSGSCTSQCPVFEGVEIHALLDSGMRYDVLGGLPWTLTVE